MQKRKNEETSRDEFQPLINAIMTDTQCMMPCLCSIDDATQKIVFRSHTIGFSPFRRRVKRRTTNLFYTIKASNFGETAG